MKFQYVSAVVAAALGAASIGVFAQAAKAPPAKVVAKALMSKEELRVCMKLQADSKAKAAVLEEAKTVLKTDQQKVEEAKASIATLREDVNTHRDLVKQGDAAVKANAARIEAWNEELKEVEASSMKTAERRKKELLNERKEITAKDKALIAKRDQDYKLYEASVQRFNEYGKEVEGMISAWNQRNQVLAGESDKLTEMREDYAADCANRRFREEDEMAIKQGK